MLISSDELLETVSKDRYIVLFMAEWCPFCARFKPIFESYEGKVDGYKLAIVELNEDDNPLWDIFKIDAVPTVIAFNDGDIVARRDARRGIGLSKDDMELLIRDLDLD